MKSYGQEFRIQIDHAAGKKVAEMIVKEIKRSQDENSTVYDAAKRYENQYNQITRWDEQNQVCNSPWLGAADYFIPLTEWTVDAIHARVIRILFSQEPYMEAHGVESEDVEKEQNATDFADQILREKVRILEASRFFFKQALKIPFAVAKYDWQQDFDTLMRKGMVNKFVNPADGAEEYIFPDDPDAGMTMLQLMANGWVEGGQEEKLYREDVEINNGPVFRYLKFEDYAWSHTARKDERPYWEADRFYLTLNELRQKAKQGLFDQEAVDAIYQEMDLAGKTGYEQAIATRQEPICLWTWFGKLPINEAGEVDFESPDTVEMECKCIVGEKNKELLMGQFWEYQRKPHPNRVYLRLSFDDTENFEGRSLCAKLLKTQQYMNQIYNTIMNNAMLSMNKVFTRRRTLQGEEWETPEVYPGAMWDVDQQGDIQVLDLGEVKAISLEIQNSLMSFAERISNISQIQTGNPDDRNKTATEITSVISEGNIGMDKFVQACHAVLQDVCKWTLDYYHDRMPDGVERKLRGDDGQVIAPTTDNQQMYVERGADFYWNEDDIFGQFDFVWRGNALNSDEQYKIAVANDLMERYMPQPMVTGSLIATWEILKRGLLARGVKDWEKILPPRQAIIQEMQAIAQQQAVNRADAVKNRIVDERNANAPAIPANQQG